MALTRSAAPLTDLPPPAAEVLFEEARRRRRRRRIGWLVVAICAALIASVAYVQAGRRTTASPHRCSTAGGGTVAPRRDTG